MKSKVGIHIFILYKTIIYFHTQNPNVDRNLDQYLRGLGIYCHSEVTGMTSEETVELFKLVNNAKQFLRYNMST